METYCGLFVTRKDEPEIIKKNKVRLLTVLQSKTTNQTANNIIFI